VRKRDQKYAGVLKGGKRPVCTPKNYKTRMKKKKKTKAIYRLPINLPMAFFTELKQQKKKRKFVWKHKRTQIAKTVSTKKNGA